MSAKHAYTQPGAKHAIGSKQAEFDRLPNMILNAKDGCLLYKPFSVIIVDVLLTAINKSINQKNIWPLQAYERQVQ